VFSEKDGASRNRGTVVTFAQGPHPKRQEAVAYDVTFQRTVLSDGIDTSLLAGLDEPARSITTKIHVGFALFPEKEQRVSYQLVGTKRFSSSNQFCTT
jgi:hypothetical protein